MGEFNLKEFVKYSGENPVTTNLCDSQKVSVSLLCMEDGQTALEETKDNKVTIIIDTGSGSIVTEEGEQDVEEGTFVLFERGEARLLKAKTRLTALVTAIQKT
ncbi:MAG: cupin domain-containing protein [Planctomycetota bacterium]|jgi:quercetin dioxygenase-like cupin family protein